MAAELKGDGQEQAAQLLRGRFGDVDEMAEATGGWTFDFRQLDCGPEVAEFVQLQRGSTRFMDARLNRQYHQRGASPSGIRTFGITHERISSLRWCGRDVTENTLLSFSARRDFEAISYPGFAVYTLSFAEDQLLESAELLGYPDADRLLQTREQVTECDAAAMQELRNRVHAIFGEATERPPSLGSCLLEEQLSIEIPAQLFKCLDSSRPESGPVLSRNRKIIMRRALEFMEAHAHEPTTVSEVCRAVGVSWRTLDYAFRAELDATPKQYLQAIRLNGVLRGLRSAGPFVKVADVANRWGFWHLGQFAADYRKRFDELPSTTLARALCRS